jgi:hypothetical protein
LRASRWDGDRKSRHSVFLRLRNRRRRIRTATTAARGKRKRNSKYNNDRAKNLQRVLTV